jgi:hypothetical protein
MALGAIRPALLHLHFTPETEWFSHVRFGSKADMCSAKGDVRFAPDSDRESGFSQKVMSALPLKADMCGARGHVCFGPIADIQHMTSASTLTVFLGRAASSHIFGHTPIGNIIAVLRLLRGSFVYTSVRK